MNELQFLLVMSDNQVAIAILKNMSHKARAKPAKTEYTTPYYAPQEPVVALLWCIAVDHDYVRIYPLQSTSQKLSDPFYHASLIPNT